jgi:hypothetical protein
MSGTGKIEYLCGFVKNKNKMPILRTGGPFVDFVAGWEENTEDSLLSYKNFFIFRTTTGGRTVMPSLFGGCL